MPRDLTFYGASDDLFECVCRVPGNKDTDEIGCYSEAGVFVIEASGYGSMQVVGLYAGHNSGESLEGSVWSVGIAPIGEDIPLPDWPIRYTAEGYSTRLTVTVPDNAIVRVSKVFADRAA